MEAIRSLPDEIAQSDTARPPRGPETPSEPRFDRLTHLLATALEVPIALLALGDATTQRWKSSYGLPIHELPDAPPFVAELDASRNPPHTVIADLTQDRRYCRHPRVTSVDGVRACAWRTVRGDDGTVLGTLGAIDRRPRVFSAAELSILDQIAELVTIELRRTTSDEILSGRIDSDRRRGTMLDSVREGFVLHDTDGRILESNAAAERMLGLTGDQIRGRLSSDPEWDAIRPDGTPYPADERPSLRALRTGTTIADDMYGVRHSSGRRVWLTVSARPVFDDVGSTTGVVTSFTDATAEVAESRRRRELEDELARREETARVSLDALEHGVILAGAGGAIPRLNPAAERILGYSADELTARWQSPDWTTWDEHGAVLEGVDRPIVRALMTGEAVTGQIIGWRRKDGQRVLLRISCVPNVDGDLSVLISFAEVTEEYRARKLLDTVLEVAPVGLAVLDSDGCFLRTNKLFAAQLGRDPAELTSTSAIDSVHPDDVDRATEASADLISGSPDRVSFEHRVVGPDGSERWMATSLAITELGEQHLSVAASFDITERMGMVQALARYGHLFESADDLIVVVDGRERIVMASPSTERMFGDVIGESITDLVHPDDRAMVIGAIGSGEGIDEGEQVIVRVHDRDGQLVHLECVGMNLLDNPAVRGIVVTGRDVTARIELTSKIEHQAMCDSLTSLANRHHLQRVLEAELINDTERQTLGLLFIDLDDFKNINDRFGHAAGDAVLCEVASLLEASVRADDLPARVGGDEFVAVLRSVGSVALALGVATRFRDALVALPHTYGPLGASIGVAVAAPGDTFSSLLERADAAMYRAKARGDSSIEVAADHGFIAATSPDHVPTT